MERYQRQLGLPLSTLARLLGPTLVKSVALTGSDPSFPLGTDVAVLLETPQPATLSNVLLGRIALAAADVKDAKAVRGTAMGWPIRGSFRPIGPCRATWPDWTAPWWSPIRSTSCSNWRPFATAK